MPPEQLQEMLSEESGFFPEEEALAQPDPMQLAAMIPQPELDYNVRLAPDAREELGRLICNEIMAYQNATEERRSNGLEYRRDVSMLSSDQGGPWEGSSEVRAPITALAAQNHATRLNSAIGGQSPAFTVRGHTPDAQEAASALEEAINSLLERAGWREQMRLLHAEIPVVCPAGLRVEWETTKVRIPKPQIEVDEDAIQEYLQQGLPPDEAMLYAVQSDDKGETKTSISWEDRVIYDGPTFRTIPFEQLILLPHNADCDKHLWGIGEVLQIRGYDLVAGKKAKKYIGPAVAKLLQMGGDSLGQHDDEVTSELSERINVEFEESRTTRGSLYETYECAELYWKDDLNNDGEQEWYIVTVHLSSQTLLRVQYSPYWHGKPSIVVFPYNEQARHIFGESVAEKLAVMQDAATSMLNQFIDAADRMVASTGFMYDSRAGKIRPDEWDMTPARPLRVESLDGIMINPVSSALAGIMDPLLKALGQIKTFSELLTASSNPVLGATTGQNQTLGEVQTVVGQSQLHFENWAQGVAIRWGEVADRVRWMIAQFSSDGSVQYEGKTGEFQSIPVQLFERDIAIYPAGMGNIPDHTSRLQRDMLTINTATQIPLVANSPKLLAMLLRQFFQDIRWPGWEKLASEVDRAAMQMEQAMQMQQQAQEGMMQQQQEQAMQQQGMAEQQQAQVQQQAQHQMGREQEEMQMKRQQMQLDGVLKAAQAHKALSEPLANGKKGAR